MPPQYSIEARTLSNVGGTSGQDFWVLRDENGQALAELHGLATDRQTGRYVPIGTDEQPYSLRVWHFARDADYAHEQGVTTSQDTCIMNGQHHRTLLTADREEAMARWDAAVAAQQPLNALDLNYPNLGVRIFGETLNSNSTYRTLGEIMGVQVRDFPGVIEPGVDNRMVFPQEIDRMSTHGYPTLREPTIRLPHPLCTESFVRPDFNPSGSNGLLNQRPQQPFNQPQDRLPGQQGDAGQPDGDVYRQALQGLQQSPNIPPGTFTAEQLPVIAANLAAASQNADARSNAGGQNQRLERIDAVVFNNNRTALISVQGALQDPGSRMTVLPVAQAEDLSMAQAAQSLEQSALRQQARCRSFRGRVRKSPPRAPYRAHRRSPGRRRGPLRSDPIQRRARRPRRSAL